MILFWMRAFKKPNAEQDEALKQMYMALTHENQKKAGKKYNGIIAGYLTIALICLIATVGYMAYCLFLGVYNLYYLVFDIIFVCLSIYATYTSSSWIGAKPYQKLLININFAENLYNSQDNSQPTESQMVEQLIDKNKQTDESAEQNNIVENQSEQQNTNQNTKNSNQTDEDNKN